MRKRELVVCGTLALIAAGVYAPKVSAQSLVVHTMDGESKEYALESTNRLVFADGEIRLADPSGRLMEKIAYNDVNFITFSDVATSILPVWDKNQLDGSLDVLHYNNSRFLYMGFKESVSGRAYIYLPDGTQVGNASIVSQNSNGASRQYYVLDISSLPSGVYVCRVGNYSFKFTK